MAVARHNYALYLDTLRKDHNFSQIVFCDGICSVRNYRRYIIGNIEIPHEKIELFCQKIGITLMDFYVYFHQNIDLETQDLSKINSMIINRKYVEAFNLLNKYKNYKFSSTSNRKLYEYLNLIVMIELNRISSSDAYQSFVSLIDYPSCLKWNIFDVTDVAVLLEIAKIQIIKEDITAMNKLIYILTNKEAVLMSPSTNIMLTVIYSSVAIMAGRLDNFKRSLELTNLGLKFSEDHLIYTYHYWLRYVKTISLKELGRLEEAEIEAAKCIAVIIGHEEKAHLPFIKNILNKDFNGVDTFTFLEKHKDVLLDIKS